MTHLFSALTLACLLCGCGGIGSNPAVSPVVTVTNDYTVQATDELVLVNGAGKLITVPSSGPGVMAGEHYSIKSISGTNTVLATTLIDGQPTAQLRPNWTLTIRSDGETWNIISRYQP